MHVATDMCERAVDAEDRASYIQGFHYKPEFVIRDVMRFGDQVLWRGPDTDRTAFERAHAIERMRVVLAAALNGGQGR